MKKRLLYIGNKPKTHGGTVTTIETMTTLLEQEGYQVYTASSVKNVPLRLLDMLRTTWQYRNKVDLVLIDTYSTLNFYYAVSVGRLCRILKLPYVPILHGGNLPNRLKRSPKLAYSLFRKAKFNVSPSLFIQEKFREAAIENVIFIPNTIELGNYSFLLRKDIKPRMLWVRSFSEIYNPLLALQTLETLLKQGIDASLIMVGPEKDGFLKTCKAYAQEHQLPVRFTGRLEKIEWTALAAKSDIFINTTNFDNMPVSVIEAMALGLPVVSTNVGGLPYLIENEVNGILVPPHDVQKFSDAIIALIANPSMAQKLSENGRRKAEAYNWAIVKEQWIGLIN